MARLHAPKLQHESGASCEMAFYRQQGAAPPVFRPPTSSLKPRNAPAHMHLPMRLCDPLILFRPRYPTTGNLGSQRPHNLRAVETSHALNPAFSNPIQNPASGIRRRTTWDRSGRTTCGRSTGCAPGFPFGTPAAAPTTRCGGAPIRAQGLATTPACRVSWRSPLPAFTFRSAMS